MKLPAKVVTITSDPTPAADPWPELRQQRRAIVVVDVVESVRLMQANEADVIDRWRRFVHEARVDVLPAHGGQMIKSLGDGMLLVFDAVRPALRCADDLRACLARLDRVGAALEPIRLRIGVHYADVVLDVLDVYGAAVNLTARLAGLAGPGEVVASVEAVDEIVPGLDADIDDLGDCYLKHIENPVRAYRVLPHVSGSPGSVDTTRSVADEVRADLPRPKVAVLTLEGDGHAPALPSMISDEVAVQLSAHSTIDVISRMSTRHAHGVQPTALLRRLGASYAVSGSCASVGGKILFTIELVFAQDERVVWSHRGVATLEQLVAEPAAFLSEICATVMASIEAHETGRARSLPLASLGSYSLLIGGVRLMHRLSRADFERAHEVLEALVARHPRHPDGYAWLAKWHILQVHQGWSVDPGKSAGMGGDMARRALERDDQCGVAMVVSGMVKTFNHRDLAGAEVIYRKALDIHPNDALAWLLKGMVHAFRGEGEEAVLHARRASALSPLDPMRYYFDSLGASAEASAGNYEQAVLLARRSLSANAMHASTLRILTIALAMLERMDESREVVRRLLALEPDFSVERFLARSPSADFAIGRKFADALGRAGVPY